MNIETATKNFSTSDLGLATFLHCIGAQLQAINRQDPKRSIFLFRLGAKHADSIAQWQSGTAKVYALAFWNSFQTVKRLLFEQGDRGV